MSLKELLAQFWKEQKPVVIGLLVALITLLGGAFFGGQQNPPPQVVVEEAMALQSAQSAGELTTSEQRQLEEALGDLLTFSCPSGTANIQVEGSGILVDCVFDEGTPVPTATLAASATFTPTLTSTATSTVTPTITPLPPTPTSTSTPTKTPTPTITPTLCTGARCPTPTKTSTPAPVTPTAVATVTPVITGTPILPTPTQLPGDVQIFFGDDGCEIRNEYHPVLVGVLCSQYHTGANMRDPEIQKLFDTYAYPGLVNEILDTYGEVIQPLFVSNAQEIPHHYRGYKWIVDVNEDCDQFPGGAQDFSGWACLVYSANRIHDDGTVEHTMSRYHSAFFIRTVCGKGSDGVWQKSDITPANCAVYYNPQLMDFGEMHKHYKDIWNPIPGTDSNCFSFPAMPPDLLNGGLYRITTPEERPNKPPITGWWGQPPNAVEKNCYMVNPQGQTPNAGQTITWMSTAWQIYEGQVANFPIEDQKAFARTIPVSPLGGNHTFTIINARVLFQVPGAGTYWIDQWGNLKVGCAAISSTCYPLVVVGNPPLDANGLTLQAILQRRSNPNSLLDCILSPCLHYAEPGEEVFPSLDSPLGPEMQH